MIDESPGGRIAYSGRATNWPYLLLIAFVVASWIVLHGVYSLRVLIVAVVCVGLPQLAFTSMRTVAGPTGVVVRYGFGAWRLRYPVETIERADVIDPPADRAVIRFWRQEFWRRHTVGSAPYLRLHLTDGRRVILTAPDPYAAATVVNLYAGTATWPNGLPA